MSSATSSIKTKSKAAIGVPRLVFSHLPSHAHAHRALHRRSLGRKTRLIRVHMMSRNNERGGLGGEFAGKTRTASATATLLVRPCSTEPLKEDLPQTSAPSPPASPFCSLCMLR